MSDALAGKPIRPQELTLLIGVLILGVIPHFWHMHASLPGFFIAAATMRLSLWRKPKQLPPRLLLLLLTIIGITLVIIQVGFSEGRQFGVALLVVMLGLKLLEVRTRRDLYIVIILGYFLMITQFLFDQSPVLAIYLFCLVIVLTAILNSVNRIQEQLLPWDCIKQTSRAIAFSIPVMITLFILFPRLDGPLWSFNLGASGKSGMSDRIHMGSVSQLSLSTEPAFRVVFNTAIPEPRDRYWRGIVLWNTDGRNWTRAHHRAPSPAITQDLGASIDYTITMEPTGQQWLFPLDRASGHIPKAYPNIDGEYLAQNLIKSRQSYSARSDTDYLDANLTPTERQLGLQLPDRGTQRMRSLVEQWRATAQTNRDVIELALQHFNQNNFIYTLQPPLLGDNPVDQFLFESQKGFCEHYATSFVYLMRLAGIPSRVIGGYLGGEINPIGGHLLVKQSDAHAWAEVWLEDEGWTRIDPTAAVAPERIELPLDPQALGEGTPAMFYLGNLSGVGKLMRQLGWLQDNMTMSWHQWIVGYNKAQQKNLLDKLGLGFLEGTQLAVSAIIIMLFAAFLGFLVTLAYDRERLDASQRYYRRFKQKLSRAGLVIPVWMGPLDIRDLAIKTFPRNRVEICRITSIYIPLRYGSNIDQQCKNLKAAVSQLRVRKAR